ncbi:ATP-dependent DNA helicase RecG [Mobilicoccus pelagius]|uniref:ATP-dependent DNA helicase RecG n=1 Tax=Mobilicoccus pelagius NBRC 104925 TaxID=1089455 RepID=H5UNF2_9MICO|nr:ATP-dependent DNA helicase RecG [Mobilicoccus pelagius]GAB47260.1 ATP-dependent DNA helicase RecG [Mobilicoccus pelagius NBRC 104925]
MTGKPGKVGHTSDHGPLAGVVHIPGVDLPQPVPLMRPVDLSTRLTSVLAERTCSALSSARGIETVEDLLWFVPTRFGQVSTSLRGLWPGRYLVVPGEITQVTTKQMRAGRRSGQRMLTATVATDDGDLTIVFFTAYGHETRLVKGAAGLFQGPVTEFNGRWQIAHPFYDLLDERPPASAVRLDRQIIPVYRQVKKMTSWSVGHAARLVVDALEIDEPLPEGIRAAQGLPTFAEAMRLRHLPATRADLGSARRRFAYDEALAIQVVLAERRREARTGVAAPRVPPADGLLARFDDRLPFELTEAQREAGEQIAADLAREQPMNRLLQGEVGSGKTLVALRAMLAVVDGGGQCALLAPTEVLATQHHRSITAMLGDLAEAGLLGGDLTGTRVTLLTGSMSTAARKKALLDIATGQSGIVVGTHALLQDKVAFHSLGLVVVDEQHRFGVEQRDALSEKVGDGARPHLLVMTATPIPRTVAMTVFGDMDVTTMRQLPRGRSPIATHVVDNPRWYDRAWERVAEEVRAGHQAYVVCPRIDGDDTDDTELLVPSAPEDEAERGETDDPRAFDADAPESEDALFTAPTTPHLPELAISDLSAVGDVADELRARPDFAGIRVGVLHGRLPAEEKDAIMTAFAAGDVDVLVSTTVVEVGVDVPNATVMVVMNADRFGVSQLHQLRGRVGRGSAPGLCLLVTRSQNEASQRRVQAVAELTDGFALADVDLHERREGDVLGARQSGGGTRLRALRLVYDEEIIAAARQDATDLLASDPVLEGHPALRRMVLAAVDDEAAEFLTRG